ncbi:MAG: MFS transporter [Burkholderiaceae bacterium]
MTVREDSSRAANPPPQAEVGATLRELAVAAFASALSMRVCDPMLPRIAEQFDRPITDLSGVVTAFAVAYGLFSLIHGPLGDRRGKLESIAVATVVAALGSLACWLAWSPTSLIAFRFLTGAACAGLIPLSLAWIGDSVPLADRQRTLARFGAAAVTGLIAGQVIGGLFADAIGWRSAFLLPSAMFGFAGVRLFRSMRARAGSAHRVEPTGVMAGYRALLRNPRARFLMLTVAVEGASAFGILAFIPTYLHLRFELPLWHAGLLVALYGVGGLLFALQAGLIIRRLGPASMARAGGLALLAGFGAVAFAPMWPVAASGCALAGFGFSMLHNTLQTGATQAHPQARGTAIAGFAMSLFVGQSIGVAVSASLVERLGFTAVFTALGTVLAVIGLIVHRANVRSGSAAA